MQVPNVTLQEDLQAFQREHFPSDQTHQPSILETDVATDEDLGCYPDGVKRTLTDEQIEMFRHSEIHTLLRKRQLQDDNAEYEARTKMAAQDMTESQEDTVPESQHVDSEAATRPSSDHQEQLAHQQGNNTQRAGAVTATTEPLDYGDASSTAQAPAENPQISRSQYQGRKIISYDD
ncbi:unnamed protein product [Penicillium olsonii]|nr:unnamed protein product [Penicillium olsonii]